MLVASIALTALFLAFLTIYDHIAEVRNKVRQAFWTLSSGLLLVLTATAQLSHKLGG
jgi:hypothetical protein